MVGGPPPWVRLTTLILSLAGLGVSIYLTITHYSTSVSLACPDTGTINCEKVTTSPESVVFGIPVAVLGLAFFVFMVAVNNPLAWRSPLRAIHLARVLSVIVGIGFVIYLIYVELFKVNAICLWCTSVHVITFALFVLILFSAALGASPERSRVTVSPPRARSRRSRQVGPPSAAMITRVAQASAGHRIRSAPLDEGAELSCAAARVRLGFGHGKTVAARAGELPSSGGSVAEAALAPRHGVRPPRRRPGSPCTQSIPKTGVSRPRVPRAPGVASRRRRR